MSEPTATTNSDGQAGFRFAPGTLLAERYVVERGLGRGGMGEVYQVRDTALGEVVALKMLSARLASDPVALSRFQGEAKNARRITHPSVCRIHDFGVHGDGEHAQHFLTMELLRGETLEARMKRSPLSRPDVLEVFLQVAAGVDAAHAVGIVHRDLKPSNVMLVAHPGGGTRAVVTDFGLARQVDESRITSDGWVGTPAYVAPEQIEGEPGDRAADVYAFGVMLFEAAVGRLPFEAATGGQVALQRLVRPAPRARSVDATISAEWDEAIARCLEQKPEQRFARASDAVRAMAGELPGEWSSSGRGGSPRSRTSGLRPRTGLLLVAVLVTAATIGAAVARQRLSRGGLPPAGRVLAVSVLPAAGATPPVLPKEYPPFDAAAAWVMRHEWTRLEDQRRFRLSSDTSGNVEARVEWAPTEAGMKGVVAIAAGGRELARFEAEAPSIRELAIALHPRVSALLGEGQPVVELFPEEREEMARWAAPDVRGYKDLKLAIDDAFTEITYDDGDIRSRLAALGSRYPGWPHAILGGIVSTLGLSLGRAEASRYLPLATPGSDPLGLELLGEIAKGRGARIGAPASFERLWGAHDRIVDFVLCSGATGATPDDTRALESRLGERYPASQFAISIPPTADGRPGWHSRAPGQRQAWLTTLGRQAFGEGEGPRLPLLWFARLHGDLPQNRLAIAAVHLMRFELDAVRAMTPTLLATPPRVQANGRALLGQAEVLRGQMRAARELLLRAWQAAEEAGGKDFNFWWIQVARELMRIDMLEGQPRSADRHRVQLVENLVNFAWPAGFTSAQQWDAERARSGRCPPLQPAVLPAAADQARDAVRLIRRAATAAGCGDCAAVLADGASLAEPLLPWSDVYARCAVERGEGLDVALRALRTADRYPTLPLDWNPTGSAVDVVLAHYWMARILEKQGKPAEAKVKYERFLQFWGAADIPIAEVDDAKKRVAALGAGAK